MDNPVVSLNNDYDENPSSVLPNDKEIKLESSLNNDSSSEKTLGNTVKSIKLKQQIRQLKGKLEKSWIEFHCVEGWSAKLKEWITDLDKTMAEFKGEKGQVESSEKILGYC